MPKKIPVRQCVACRQQKEKPQLARITRTPQGDIVYDPKGKAQDIFAYADQKMPKTGGAFTGGVSGVSPTSGSTKGFRNIYFGSGAPASSLGANGDVYINIG